MSRATGTAFCLLAATLLGGLAGPAWAQGTAPPPADPIVAKVDGQPIHLSELKDAVQGLPANVRGMPTQTLYPMLLDQMIDGRLLVAEARKSGLDKDPTVQRQVAAAEDRALQTAMLNKEVGPSVTEEAVHARYDQDIAGKPGEEEVHAKHILVDNEAEAKKIIAQLKDGGDFSALAKQYSKDPSGAQQGGDLGFFKKDEMVPEFATAAFALQPGQVSPEPVHTQFGWHVIQVVERAPCRTAELRSGARRTAPEDDPGGCAEGGGEGAGPASVEKFNLDGSPVRPTDTAEPPPAPSKQ